jgi:pimeloyl-ACP methyl ester carboxylesterase
VAVALASTVFGDGPPLVILHGLFGSGRNWHAIGKRLARHHRVHVVDARNHGRSPWAEPMTYEAMVDDVRAFLDRQGIGRTVVLGHSMGGKTAMLFALLHADRVDGLIFVDIAPVAYDHTFVPYVRAMERLDIGGRPPRAELERRLNEEIGDLATCRFLLQNLTARHDHYTWRINLAAIRRHMADLTGFPDVGFFVYDGPSLALCGALSDYVSPAHHEKTWALFPQTRFEVVPEAGHRVHADRPEQFLEAVEAFLAEI